MMTQQTFGANMKNLLNGRDERAALNMPDAEVVYYANLFSPDEADKFFSDLLTESDWTQEHITIHGKRIPIPRLTAWCGEPNKTYAYSGIKVVAGAWTDALLQIKNRIEKVSNASFNSVLLNLYRHGADSVAWHADDEKELGMNPVIGSVSFGAPRKFQMKHKTKRHKRDIELRHGDYLLMAGETQHHWIHQIPKTKREVGARINLTFRRVVNWRLMRY